LLAQVFVRLRGTNLQEIRISLPHMQKL